jgi:hypothetical protein
MKYAFLNQVLALRGRQADRAELGDGRSELGDYGAILPRLRGRLLTISTAKIASGPHDGAVAVVATERSYTSGAEEADPVVYLGYADEEAAYQDALRLIVSTALKDGTVEAITGWGGDAVVLLPGAFGGAYTVRIASVLGDPTQSGLYAAEDIAPEEISDAGDVFADQIDELIGDLAERADNLTATGVPDEAELLRDLALPWLSKEAAQHRAASARQRFLAAAHPSGGIVGPRQLITMSELARRLYVDRGNLTRTINQALAEEAQRR